MFVGDASVAVASAGGFADGVFAADFAGRAFADDFADGLFADDFANRAFADELTDDVFADGFAGRVFADDFVVGDLADDFGDDDFADSVFTADFANGIFADDFADVFADDFADRAFAAELADDVFAVDFADDVFAEDFADGVFAAEFPNFVFAEGVADDVFADDLAGFGFAAAFFAVAPRPRFVAGFFLTIVISVTSVPSGQALRPPHTCEFGDRSRAMPHLEPMKLLPWLALVALTGACSDDDTISSDEEARRAYFGLDESIAASITLGFAGFNSASSANIAPQTAAGIAGGTLTVTGQVDQGSSNNKGMRLKVGMVAYTDGLVVIDGTPTDIDIVYDTSANVASQPSLTMQLKGIPTGTLDGTLVGDYTMTGDIEGTATLNLTFTGKLMDAGGGKPVRVPGMTHVTGTAVSGDGTYAVDVTL